MDAIFYVYILASTYMGTLYIGHTDNLENRIRGHKAKTIQGFTSKYNVTQLVYYETFASREEAFLRERQLKHCTRLQKVALIEQDNPRWLDLAASWDKATAI